MSFKLDPQSARQIRAILASDKSNIIEMALEIGENPATFFEGEDLSDLDLTGCDLSNISFCDANMNGVTVTQDQADAIKKTKPGSMAGIVVLERIFVNPMDDVSSEETTLTFLEKCLERATVLAVTCGWLVFGGGLESTFGVAIGDAGLAAGVSGVVRDHGPESHEALRAIRGQVAKDLNLFAEIERWDTRAELAAADIAMERGLTGCFIDRQELIALALDPQGFPDAATKLIIGNLAERDPEMFGAAGPAVARGYANLVVKTACQAMIENEGYFKNLRPHLVMETLRGIGSLEEAVDKVHTDVRTLSEKLSDLLAAQALGIEPSEHGLLLSDLQELARLFGVTEETTGNGLTAFLVQKAKEYKLFAEQIEAIDDQVAGLGNLKATARNAADNLNFDEVETLLARVDEVEAGLVAGTKELRATNALLRGHSEQDHPIDWAMTQNILGSALHSQGERVGGEAGNQLLSDAVIAYKAALRVYTEQDHPIDWAMTQNNLGAVFLTIAMHEGCNNPFAYLKSSLSHIETALTVFKPETMSFYHDHANGVREDILAQLDKVEWGVST